MISPLNEIKIGKAQLYPVPLRLAGCKLPSGVAVTDASDAIELTDDNEDKTSDTGATPSDESISSNSLFAKNQSINRNNLHLPCVQINIPT